MNDLTSTVPAAKSRNDKRLGLTIAAAVSVLLFVGSAGLWVGTHVWGTQEWTYDFESTDSLDYGWDAGVVGANYNHRLRGVRGPNELAVEPARAFRVQWADREFELSLWGLEMYRAYPVGLIDSRTPGVKRDLYVTEVNYFIAVPCWMIITATAVPAMFFGWRWLRRRPGVGECRVCGYDLRASPGRCPECGTPVGEVSGVGAGG